MSAIRFRTLLGLVLGATSAIVQAQVKTDGSLGARQTLGGPNFAIPATLGRQVGPNLFHSFSDFNVQTGQSATFSGPASVQNVLSRVTGGRASTIDGTLRCDIAGANLYLINPAGVVFGPNATLDVSGSFAVTSADSLRLGKGAGRFNAKPAANEVLTSAPVTAFGFLGRGAGTISVNGAHLAVANGQTLSIVANGDVRLSSATLNAPSGRVNVVAAAAAGQVGLRPDDADSPIDSNLKSYADVDALQATAIDVSGDPGGSVSMRAADLTVEASTINSSSRGSTAGRPVDLRATGDLSLTDGSVVFVGTLGLARGGDVEVSAGSFKLNGGSQIVGTTLGAAGVGAVTVAAGSIAIDGAGTAIANGPAPAATGAGGNIALLASHVAVTDGAKVIAGTVGAGSAGAIRVRSDDLLIAGDGVLRSTGLFAGADPGTAGAGGNVSIRTGALRMSRAGIVSIETEGSGAGGNLDIAASSVSLVDPNTLLLGNTRQATGGGPAGNVRMDVGSLELAGGAGIVGGTFGDGRGGNVTIRATGDATIRGPGSFIAVATTATPGGPGGSLDLSAATVEVRDGGSIVGGTAGSGAAGSMTLMADAVRVVGDQSVIRNGTDAGSTGSGGNLVIRAAELSVTRHGTIGVSTFSSGNGGTLDVAADSIFVSSGGLIQGGTLAEGAGGNVTLSARSLSILQGGTLFGGTQGSGPGGDMSIAADDVTLSGSDSLLFAGTTAPIGGGPGGRLRLRARSLSVADGAGVAAGTIGSGNGGSADIAADRVVLRGRDGDDFFHPSTFIAVATGTGTGRGGTLNLTAGTLRVENGAAVGAGSGGPALGGQASISAERVALDGGAILAATIHDAGDPIATGEAGSVRVSASKSISLRDGAQIGAASEASNAGSLTLAAPRITLRNSKISADAAQAGGSITVNATNVLYLFRSQINAVGQAQLGNINIDPIFTVLDRSSIMTTTDATGGNISLRTDRFFKSLDSTITAARNATVTLTIYTPDTNITGSLVPVNASLADRSASFAEECSRRLRVDLSSFLITGRGGVPILPGGLDPAFDLGTIPATGPSPR